MPATAEFPVTLQNVTIYQGAAYYDEYELIDNLGAPVDLSVYDILEAEFRDGQSPTAVLEAAATVAVVGAAANGIVSVTIPETVTFDIIAANGFWTLSIEDSGTPNSRRRLIQGTYFLDPTTIAE